VDLRGLAAICAEIRERTAGPDPDDDPGDDSRLDRSVSVDTTMDGVGVMRADLTAECAAMVTSVLDALSAPTGGGDLRTQPQRYHDALEEAMPSLEKCIVTGVDQLDLVLPRRHFAGHVVHHRGQQQRCRFEPLGCPPPMS
jgi:hypothetical protein